MKTHRIVLILLAATFLTMGNLSAGLAKKGENAAPPAGAIYDPDPSHLGGQRVGDVVAIEIERRNHVELIGPQQYLL